MVVSAVCVVSVWRGDSGGGLWCRQRGGDSSGGGGSGVNRRRVRKSDIEDWIDRSEGNNFGLGRKPTEKTFRRRWWLAGGRGGRPLRWREKSVCVFELPPNGKTVDSKWLFKKKTDTDGNVHIYKARLVAKGFTQTPGIDYEETFSPVADIRAIRILIAITAYYDYEIWLMDVKTAFLNGYLNEEIYRDRSKRLIGLCQSAYIEKILKRYSMENSKRGSIPMQEKLKLSKSQGASTPAEMKRM
nr:retrotransposon protein, putative, Ty1-copia subclass [Tanacetum cinerariifolium]